MYDYVFVTHLPAFYKTNLYNRIVQHCKVFVIFIASDSSIRTPDFIHLQCQFDYQILHSGDFETRPKGRCLLTLIALLSKLHYKRIVIGGWDLPEFWLILFLSPFSKNTLALESTVYESRTEGWKFRLKQKFLSRISLAFPSGKMHLALLKKLGYQGKSYFTKGVGLFPRKDYPRKEKKGGTKFLYIGRLAPEKNLEKVIRIFQSRPELSLTLAGTGPQETYLKSIAGGNIHFLSHVPNEKIGEIYLSHDIFLLPSLQEPWGLVVEEALYYGLPVLVSNQVGCAEEMVENGKTGILFDPLVPSEINTAMDQLLSPSIYQNMQRNVACIDFAQKDNNQVEIYIRALDL